MEQRQQFLGAVGPQDGFDRFFAELMVLRLVADAPAGGEAEFQSETPRQLHEKAVERADAEAMQAGERFDKKRPDAGRG